MAKDFLKKINRKKTPVLTPKSILHEGKWASVKRRGVEPGGVERFTHCPGARLCEPQQVDGIGTSKLVPVPVPLTTPCGSQTRAPATPATFGGPCQDAHRDVRGEIYGLFFPSDHFICFHDKRREFIRKLRTLGFNGPLSGTRHPCHHPVPLRPTLPGW